MSENALTSRLAEFETLTIFDHDFEIYRSIFYRAPKIVKIMIYTILVTRNISVILF